MSLNDLQTKLRFAQRCLESNAPESDRQDAAQMVRDVRRELYAMAGGNVERVLALMREDRERDLYEGAGEDGKSGCGLYWLTHSATATYEPLMQDQVDDLERRGAIVAKWPGCYRLAEERSRPMDEPK